MIRLTLAIVLTTIAIAPATAQYQWRDARGRMVFSDLPPPHSVARKRIIKGFKPSPRPVQAAADKAANDTTQEPDAESAVGDDSDNSPLVKSPTSRLAARLAEFDKRRDARLKSRKETNEKTKVAARKKELCRNLHADSRALTSGMRLARVNEKGEREIIGDKARKTRLNENKQLLAKHCA